MSAPAVQRVGPNAIIQTLSAVRAHAGASGHDAVLRSSRLRPPDGGWRDMVPTEQVNRLNRTVLAALGPDEAATALCDAGHRTGQYILENRIPHFAQSVLGLLPSRIARFVLLKAIRKNAWTFAGEADVQVGSDWILIRDNPVCLGRAGYAGCIWHRAVFQELFDTILSANVDVVETHCMGRGDPYCRFEINLV